MTSFRVLSTHEASAFDKGVPPDFLVTPGAVHAKAILNLRMTRIITLGVHVNDALMEAAKSGYPNAIIKPLPHPTCMSIFLCGASTAEVAAVLFDEEFGTSTETGNYVGRLFMDYRFASYPGGQGGPLHAICFEPYLENISNTARAIVHHLVAALCTELGIKSDEEAATYLRGNGYKIHLLQTRTLMYIQICGRKGGYRGTTNNHLVLAAKSNRDAAIKDGCDAATITDMESKLEKAIEASNAIAKKREVGIRGKPKTTGKYTSSKLQLDMVDTAGLITLIYSSKVNVDMANKLIELGLAGSLRTAQTHLTK